MYKRCTRDERRMKDERFTKYVWEMKEMYNRCIRDERYV